MKKIAYFFIASLFLVFQVTIVSAQDVIQITPKATNLKGYIFDSQLKFVNYLPVAQDGSVSINDADFTKNNYFIVLTSGSDYYYIGSSQQIVANKKIQLTEAAPLPWIKISNDKKLITSQNQYINLHAHGGLTYSLENDLLGIIRLKLLGFNGFRLVFRSFDADSKGLPGLYLKTTGPFNQTISGFTENYINEYIVPKIQLAKLLGMYVILDHHAMFIHDKSVNDEYETNPDDYNAWLDLWKHLSEKFKDEPAIAIYEVQNEPGSKLSQDFVLKMHNDVIKIIRENDTNHIIAFGHSWNNIDQQFYLDKGIPYDPSDKLIYSMHHYYKIMQPDGGLAAKIQTAVRIGQKYKIPIWFGETGYKNDYSASDVDMLERWYDYADKNFISTSLWWDDDIMGTRKNNTDPVYIEAMNVKKRVFLSESSNGNIRCYRKDYNNGESYIIQNPDPNTAAHLRINYPVMNNISFSPDNSGVKIVIVNGYASIDGKFSTIKVTLK